MLLRLWAFGLVLLSAVGLMGQVTSIDPAGSAVTFEIRNAGLDVEGRFGAFAVELSFSPQSLASSYVTATIEVNSLDTGIELRDDHLQKAKYFDAAQHPQISFRSNQIRREGAGYVAEGTLRIKGQSQEISLPFTFDGTYFQANYTLDRLDFGVGSSSWVLDETVRVSLRLQAK